MKAVFLLSVVSAMALMLLLPSQTHAATNTGLGQVVAQLMTQLNAVKSRLDAVETDLKTTKTNQATTNAALDAQVTAVKRTRVVNTQGSTFVRWGRRDCPYYSKLVYTGFIGGKLHKGGGTNLLCMTKNPLYYSSSKSSYAYLYGAEYYGIIKRNYNDAVCAVCAASLPTTIMVPGTYSCPSGWRRQYYGHIVAAYYAAYATEHVCLDYSPQYASGGASSKGGVSLYYVSSQCGSLHCPPYKSSRELSCAVCSK